MRTAIALVLVSLAAVAGCRQGPKPPSSPKAPKPDDLVVGAVKGVRDATKRIVDAKDMEQLSIYFNFAADGATGRVPGRDVILADVKKADPKLGKLLEDGDIILTGIMHREGLWAYVKDAPTKGGWVLTPNGPQRLTAEEVKQRLAAN